MILSKSWKYVLLGYLGLCLQLLLDLVAGFYFLSDYSVITNPKDIVSSMKET
jgi:hypothetical protein